MKPHVAALVAGLALSAFVVAPAAQAQISIGAHAATTGFGPDVQWRLNDQFTVRGAGDWMDFSASRSYSGVDYNGHLKMSTGSAFLDWHPWSNAFFLSGGAYFGDRKVTLAATPSSNVTIGGQSFTPAQVGRLDGVIKMDSAAPFAGVGFDTNAKADAKGFGFKGVLGVAFSGKPKVTLTSSGGLLSNQAAFQPYLDQEQRTIADKASFLQYYPVIQAGVTYRF